MKMIFAIVRKEDEGFVIERLNKEKISVTKLSSTGGFLRKGNATLMIGTEDDKVDFVINVIREECSRRQEVMINPSYSSGSKGPVLGYTAPPVSARSGGSYCFCCKCRAVFKAIEKNICRKPTDCQMHLEKILMK